MVTFYRIFNIQIHVRFCLCQETVEEEYVAPMHSVLTMYACVTLVQAAIHT